MSVIAGLDDPATVRCPARDNPDVSVPASMSPHNNDAFGRAIRRPTETGPPASQISGRIGNPELAPHPPAAPGARTAPIDHPPRPFGHDGHKPAPIRRVISFERFTAKKCL